MEEKKKIETDKELQEMYIEKERLMRLIGQVTLDIQKHIEENYPEELKEITVKMKRLAMYRDGFKKKRRW